MKGTQERKRKWLMLALHLCILINLCTAKSSFESLLSEYSKFKEKQIARKANKFMHKKSSVLITQKKKLRSRKLSDKKGIPFHIYSKNLKT